MRTASATADSYDPAKNPGKAVPPPGSDQVRQAVRDLAAAKVQQAHAQQAVSSAQSALDAAKRLAEQARGMREDAARRTVIKLHEASDAGIRNRHWWEKAVHWVADHWDEIVTVCKWIVAILGIVVMIIGGPLARLVVAAALIVLADTVLRGPTTSGSTEWRRLRNSLNTRVHVVAYRQSFRRSVWKSSPRSLGCPGHDGWTDDRLAIPVDLLEDLASRLGSMVDVDLSQRLAKSTETPTKRE